MLAPCPGSMRCSFLHSLSLHCCPILQWNKLVWTILLHPQAFFDSLFSLYIWIFAWIPEIFCLYVSSIGLTMLWTSFTMLELTWLFFFLRVEVSERGFSCLHDKHYTDWAFSLALTQACWHKISKPCSLKYQSTISTSGIRHIFRCHNHSAHLLDCITWSRMLTLPCLSRLTA